MSESARPAPDATTAAANPRWSRARVEALCTALGAWGIATGFAVFVLLYTHGRPHPLVFLGGLVVAALIAYIAELLRDMIKDGAGMHPITGPKVIVTVLLLMIIELVVHAGTGLAQLADHAEAEHTSTALQQIVAPVAGGQPGILTELALLTAAWMVVGAVMARRLARVVFHPASSRPAAMRRGAREGLLAGLVAAPASALACLLVLRWAGMLREMVVHGDQWARDMYGALTHNALDPAYVVAMELPGWIRLGTFHLARWGQGIGAVILVLIVALGAWWAWRRRAARAWPALVVGAVVLVLPPLVEDLDRIAQVALLAALIWIVPGFMLGIVAPLLRMAKDEPRLWGRIAFGAAALLTLATLLRLTHPWCLALACGLMAIGLLFRRGASLRDYWPLAAVAMASMVSGVMVFVERASFIGVFSHVHAIHQLPDVRFNPLRLQAQLLFELTRPEAFLDDEETRHLAGRVRVLAALPPDRQVDQLEEISELLTQLRTRRRTEQAGHLRTIAGGGLWGVLSPGDDVGQLYRDLADLVEHPPPPAERDGAFDRLLARADALLEAERARSAVLTRVREREARHLEDLEAALRSGTASEDTVQYGPETGAVAAELYAFSRLSPEVRAKAAAGPRLRQRLEALLNAEGVDVVAEPAFLPPQLDIRSGPFVTQQMRRTDRLRQLWYQFLREWGKPGSGGIEEPRIFSGDPAALPWRRRNPAPLPGSATVELKTRRDWLEDARGTIERHRQELAAGQSPAPDRPFESRFALAVTFPNAARLARLEDIERQLLAVKQAAEDVRHLWKSPPAVMLELSLAGSFGFWVTVALLAAWRLTETRPLPH